MAKSKKNKKQPSVISLLALCNKAGVTHHKVYQNLRGTYNSLDALEKSKLVNALYDAVNPFVNELGYLIKVSRIKGPE